MKIADFELSKVYKRDDLISAFGGSFMRGMNICKKTNTLVLISKHTKNRIYGDKLFQENDRIIYTGEGLVGNQTMSGANKALRDASEKNIPVYFFVVFKPQQYTYFGLVSLCDEPYFEKELDINGNERDVIRFPLIRYSGYRPLSDAEMGRQVSAGSITPISKPVVQVVGAAIVDKEERLLCAQRGYGSLIGKWEFPGGKVEPGETDEQALAREIKEELNIDVLVKEFVDESYNEYKDQNVNLKVYKCEFLSGEITDTEHQSLKWCKPEEVESLDWAEADQPIVDTYLDSLPKEIEGSVSFNYFEAKPINKSKDNLLRALQDYERSQKRRKASGDSAEIAVINYERAKLNNLARPDLADKVVRVSEKSSDYGYDVLSYDVQPNGEVIEIHIEVKSARFTGGYIEFFISENELDKFRNDKNHKIYCLIKSGRNYKLHEVNKSDFFKNEYLSPMTYRVRIRVAQ